MFPLGQAPVILYPQTVDTDATNRAAPAMNFLRLTITTLTPGSVEGGKDFAFELGRSQAPG